MFCALCCFGTCLNRAFLLSCYLQKHHGFLVNFGFLLMRRGALCLLFALAGIAGVAVCLGSFMGARILCNVPGSGPSASLTVLLDLQRTQGETLKKVLMYSMCLY